REAPQRSARALSVLAAAAVCLCLRAAGRFAPRGSGPRAFRCGAYLPGRPAAARAAVQVLRRARQAPAPAPGAGRVLRVAGSLPLGDRAAATRAHRGRWRLLPALGGGCAPEGAARPAVCRIKALVVALLAHDAHVSP